MVRIFGVIFISIFLISVCISEELLVSDTLSKIENITETLQIYASKSENVNSLEIISTTKELNEYWQNRENILCFFINYKDMSETSNEIIKMISYAENNIKEEYTTSLALVKYYCDTFDYVTRFRFKNIF